MKNPLFPFLTALAILTVAAPAISTANAADTAKTYPINLAPAYKVGTKYTLVVDVSDNQQNNVTITIPGAPTPQNQNQGQNIVAHLEGAAEVLAVYPNGSIQKVAVTVKALQGTVNGQAMQGLPAAGAKIVAEKTATGKNFTVDGQPATAAAAKLLGMLSELGDEKRTDQDVFGPKNPVAIGASWPINGDSMIAGLKEELSGEVGGVTGSLKLDAIKGAGAGRVATVSGNFSVTGVKPSLPPGMTIDSATMNGKLDGSVPATTTGTESQNIGMSMKLQMHGSSGGAEIKVESTDEQKKTEVMTYQ